MPRHSLKGRNNIQAILRDGKRYFSRTVALYFKKDLPELENTYGVAFLLSARAGNAVERNKIKRWLREDFRHLQGIKNINGAFVIKFNGTADHVSHRELTQELKKLYNAVDADEL